MSIHRPPCSVLVPGSRSQRAHSRRRAAVAQLVTGSALLASLFVAASVVLIDIARGGAAPTAPHAAGVAIAAFAAVMLAGLGGLAAAALRERRARRT